MGKPGSRSVWRVAWFVSSALLVAGCAGASPSAASPSAAGATASTAVSASQSPSAASAAPSVAATSPASASPSVAAKKLCAKEFKACPLPAGTYRAAPFEPGFTFTIEGDDWSNQRAWPHGGGVTFTDGAFFWMTGIKSGLIDNKAVDVGSTAEEVIAFLRRPDDWVVSDPQPVTIDGVRGVAVDTVTGPKPRQMLLSFPEDAFNTDPGEKIRWILLDKNGTLVVFLLDGFKKANFDVVSARVQPVIDSVAWE